MTFSDDRRFWIILMILFIVWIVVSLWVGTSGLFDVSCDDFRPREC